MTKMEKKKQYVKEELGKVATADGYGHYKNGKRRIKMKKMVFRFEINVAGSWMRLDSVKFMQVTESDIEKAKRFLIEKK